MENLKVIKTIYYLLKIEKWSPVREKVKVIWRYLDLYPTNPVPFT